MEDLVRSGVAGDYEPEIPIITRELKWPGGAILSKTRVTDARSESRFVLDRVGLGFGFQESDGEAEWRVDGKQALHKKCSALEAGRDLVVLPPGCEFHGAGTGSGECLWIYFESDALPSPDDPFFHDRPLIDSSWSRDRLAWMLISELREECRHGFPRGPVFAESAATAFAVHLKHMFSNTRRRVEPMRSLAPGKLRAITEYIEGNAHLPITLSELSGIADLTRSSFCRAFKEATGRPPHQFLIERRVEKAKALLKRPDLTLVDVALASGFSSQSHLNVHFHRIVGVTPARYRREHTAVRKRVRRNEPQS